MKSLLRTLLFTDTDHITSLVTVLANWALMALNRVTGKDSKSLERLTSENKLAKRKNLPPRQGY